MTTLVKMNCAISFYIGIFYSLRFLLTREFYLEIGFMELPILLIIVTSFANTFTLPYLIDFFYDQTK